jgi:hypothetical protein
MPMLQVITDKDNASLLILGVWYVWQSKAETLIHIEVLPSGLPFQVLTTMYIVYLEGMLQ